MFRKNYKNIFLITTSILFFSIGYKNNFDNIVILTVLNIFFTLGVYGIFILLSFISAELINATIYDAKYGHTDMRRGASNRYYIKYSWNNHEYIKRIKYSTSSEYKVGDSINILVSNKNQIMIHAHLKYFIFFDVFIILLSIIFLIISIV